MNIVKNMFDNDNSDILNNDKTDIILNNSIESSKNKKIKKNKKSDKIYEMNVYCINHNYELKFICSDINCFKRLCAICILNHKEHINYIKNIDIFFKDNLNEFKRNYNDYKTTKEELQLLDFYKINDIEDNLKLIINKKFEKINYNLIKKNEIFNNEELIKKQLINFSFNLNDKIVNLNFVKNLKLFLKNNKYEFMKKYQINKNLIKKNIKNSIKNNIILQKNNNSFQTFNHNKDIYIHYFEWGKRKLHLYNVVTKIYKQIILVIPFKIPYYSRSIIAPNGKIYLFGGENDKEINKEVYIYNTANNPLKNDLKIQTSMLIKKYDFSICYWNDYIYIISGKDKNEKITDLCERYNIITNKWESIDKVNYKRFAACAIACKNWNKIYLFGGRNEFKISIINQIEEYDVKLNKWNEIRVDNHQSWIPVELSTGIQIKYNKILIFGGNNCMIKDSKKCFIFNPIKKKWERINNLELKQVFLNSPILYGNNIFVIGNEYYVKNKNIHKYNINSLKWKIIY